MKKSVIKFLPEIAVFIFTFLMSFSHILNYSQFSPIDELRHLDYSIQISKGDLPKLGDKISDIAMREEACRGVDLDGWQDPPCGSSVLLPQQFRDDGWQTASQHPPTYYFLAGVFARATRAIGISDSLVSGARIFSALVAALGMMATCFVARRLKFDNWIAALIPIAVSTSSVYLHQSSIVSPDSMTILVGAMTLYVSFEVANQKMKFGWLYAVFTLAALTKITNLLIVVVASLALISFSIVRDKRIDRKKTISVVQASACSFILGVGWIVFQQIRATIDPSIVPQNQMLHTSGMPPLSYLMSSERLFTWFPPLQSYVSSEFTSVYTVTMLLVITWLLVGGVLFSTLNFDRMDFLSYLMIFTTGIGVLAAPLFVMLSAQTNHILINAEPRYGLSLLPAFMLGTVSLSKQKFARVIIFIFTVILFSLTLIQIWN